MVGGLEVQDKKTGAFVPAKPVADTVVVNSASPPSYSVCPKDADGKDAQSETSSNAGRTTSSLPLFIGSSSPPIASPVRLSLPAGTRSYVPSCQFSPFSNKMLIKKRWRWKQAFFSNPNLHELIACLPNTGEAKYEPVETETYLVRRLGETCAFRFPFSSFVDLLKEWRGYGAKGVTS
jgi:hypothetical protein